MPRPPRNELIVRFDLDERQAQAILDLQLRRLAALERQRLEEEYQNLQKEIQGLQELLASPAKVLAEIKKETQALKKKFGQDRRTAISDEAYDFDRRALEAHEQVVVTLSEGRVHQAHPRRHLPQSASRR